MGWDGDGCESSPGTLPGSPMQEGLASAADGARMDHTETRRAPSLAYWGHLRPYLQVPVDKQISLPLENLAAVPLALLSMGARSAPGSVCFAAATLPSLAGT